MKLSARRAVVAFVIVLALASCSSENGSPTTRAAPLLGDLRAVERLEGRWSTAFGNIKAAVRCGADARVVLELPVRFEIEEALVVGEEIAFRLLLVDGPAELSMRLVEQDVLMLERPGADPGCVDCLPLLERDSIRDRVAREVEMAAMYVRDLYQETSEEVVGFLARWS